MKCVKCKCKNNDRANYCYYCQYKFTDDDKDKASYEGLIGFVRRIEDIYSKITFDDDRIKILYIVLLILTIGFNFYFNNKKISLNENENYSYKLDDSTNTYTIYTDNEEVSVDLNIPTYTNNLNITLIGQNIETMRVNSNDNVVLKLTGSDEYYKIDYNNKHTVYIYVINN